MKYDESILDVKIWNFNEFCKSTSAIFVFWYGSRVWSKRAYKWYMTHRTVPFECLKKITGKKCCSLHRSSRFLNIYESLVPPCRRTILSMITIMACVTFARVKTCRHMTSLEFRSLIIIELRFYGRSRDISSSYLWFTSVYF